MPTIMVMSTCRRGLTRNTYSKELSVWCSCRNTFRVDFAKNIVCVRFSCDCRHTAAADHATMRQLEITQFFSGQPIDSSRMVGQPGCSWQEKEGPSAVHLSSRKHKNSDSEHPEYSLQHNFDDEGPVPKRICATPMLSRKDQLKMLTRKSQYKDIVFDDQQLKFIDSDLCDCKLLGIPGGGKTRCIIEKIRRSFQRGLFNRASDFLILTYSKMASHDFVVKAKQVLDKLSTINVRTIHSLAGTVVKHVLKRNSSSITTVIISALKLLESNENCGRVRNVECLKSIKVIFVDEAQDISESQYSFLMRLKECLGCCMVLVGDPNQNIYQFQGGSDKFLLDYPGKTFSLTNNYRSSANIVDFVRSIAPHNTQMVSSAEIYGGTVKMVTGTHSEIGNHIMQEISASKYALKDIAIIGPVRRSKPKGEGRYANIGLSLATNVLSDNNVKFLKHYDDAGNDDKENRLITERKDDHVNILTIHGSKGLEFKKVILLNFHFQTFGQLPTRREFNCFKYLWYVGCSRAEYEMTIYVDSDPCKHAWPWLQHVDPSTYELVKLTPNISKLNFTAEPLHFEDESWISSHTVTSFISNLIPEDYHVLESLVKYSVAESDIFAATQVSDVYEHQRFACLFGKFVEEVCAYEYYLHNPDSYNIFNEELLKLRRSITCPKKYAKGHKKLQKRLTYDFQTPLTLAFLQRHHLEFDQDECKWYNWLKQEMENDYERVFYVKKRCELFADSDREVIGICEKMLENTSHRDYIFNVFRVVLHQYQIEHEAGYLWRYDFSQHLQSLNGVLENVKNFITSQRNLTFWRPCEHPNFPIRGEIDILQGDDVIIEIKFTKQFTNQHVFQLLLYYNNICPAWDKKMKLKVWNFLLGKEYEITICDDLCNYDLLRYLCDKTHLKMKNLLFLYDLETTGLDTTTCEVIDRHFEEYNLGFVLSTGLVRTISEIPQHISELTHITTGMLESGDSWHTFREDLASVHKYCEKPAFMAHNGKCFDHKVLKNQGMLLGYDIDWLDSKQIIRMICDKDTKAMNLTQIYKEVMKGDFPYVAHRAREDVQMMKDILTMLHFSYPP